MVQRKMTLYDHEKIADAFFNNLGVAENREMFEAIYLAFRSRMILDLRVEDGYLIDIEVMEVKDYRREDTK